MYMKLSKEHAEGFVAYVIKNVRGTLCKKRENISTTAMRIVVWKSMPSVFLGCHLNSTFWINQRSIAKTALRSERWVGAVMKRLQEAGYLVKVTQKVYSPGKFGPNVFKIGNKLKALFWAFMKQGPQTYSKYLARKMDVSNWRKQTSDLNLKERDKAVPVSVSPSQYSFIPDFKGFIKSLG
mgnify:CR=1 FL=1